MAEQIEPIQSPASQGSTVSVIHDRSLPDNIINFDPADVPPKGDDAENLINTRAMGVAVLREWNEHKRLIEINPNLSAAGKLAAQIEALPKHLEKLKLAEQVIESHADGALEQARLLTLSEIHPEGVEAAVKREGLRQWFANLPDSLPDGARGRTKNSVLREAKESNNRELLGALLDSNPAQGLLHPKIREALLQSLIEETYPEESAKLAVKERRVAVAKAALQRVRELMSGSTPKAAASPAHKPISYKEDDIRGRLVRVESK